ncbi:MAG: Ig-like domain-containing protein [Clostridia bacterium]|nr:Ig-like domain-containing protein [Clostridia bacterium]
MMKRFWFILFAVLLTLCALADRPAPRSISLSQSSMEIDLAEANEFTLEASVSPDGASTNYKWWVSDKSVLSVEDGVVTALKPGIANVYVSVHGFSDVRAVCEVKVTDSRAPERLIVYPSSISAEPSRGVQIQCVVMPQDAGCEFEFSSSNPSVASVSETGYVSLLSPGRATITVKSAYSPSVSAEIRVTAEYKERIRSIRISESSLTLEKGDAYALNVNIQPENGSRAVVFESSDESVATVDENGLVTAVGFGSALISAASHRDPSVAASLPVTVTDAMRPETLRAECSAGLLLSPGDSGEMIVELGPLSADLSYTLSSSREDIVRLEGSTVTALKRGMSVITVQSVYREDLKAELTVIVEDGTHVLSMPLRRTDESGIQDNLAHIDSIKKCALQGLSELRDAGEINAAEYRKRVKIVESAFEMYAFPWTVDQTVKYWEAANSENGAKDFQPGVIYYGLPYTSGTNHNRTYNVERALEQKRYLPVEGKDYYLLNRSVEDYASGYAGNDCSAFVAQALWGYTIYNGDPVKTGTLYYDERLRGFDDYKALKAGDLLVRHSIHVVMFLYWADEDHTQAVFIQQGGSEPAINTVNAYVQDVSYYTDNFYRLRRPLFE